MINEKISEKLTTKIVVAELPDVPEYEYHIKIADFEKSLMFIMTILIILISGFIII